MADGFYNGRFIKISSRARSFEYRRNENIDHCQLALAGYYQCPFESGPTAIACFCCGAVVVLDERAYTVNELHGLHEDGCFWAVVYLDGVDLGFLPTRKDLLTLRYSGSVLSPSSPPRWPKVGGFGENTRTVGEPPSNYNDVGDIKHDSTKISSPKPREPREPRLPNVSLPTIYEDAVMKDN